MSRTAAVLAVSLVVASCSVASGAAPSSTSAAPVATSAPANETTTIAATTPTTTSPSSTTTTSTQAPTTTRLDSRPDATTERMNSDLELFSLRTPRPAGSSAERATIDALADAVETITGSPATIEEVALPNGTASANVSAPPIGTAPKTLLLGAHLDTIAGSPGTDDNGSGVLVLLELLRRLSASPPQHVTVHIVFFGAEEVLTGMGSNDHHYGSRQAAATMAATGDLPDMMVSVDMVGVGSQLVAVAYEDTDPNAVAALASAADSVDVALVRLSRGDISDHEAFARNGVPSAMLWRPDNPNYHGPGDDSINTDLLIENLQIIEALIANIGP